MRILSKLVLAGVVLGAFTTAASAAVFYDAPADINGPVGLTNPPFPSPYAGMTEVWNFDTIFNSNFSYSGSTFSNTSALAAEPYGETSPNVYGAGEPAGSGGDATFSINPGLELTQLSFYLGSLDTYNTLSFYNGNSLVQAFTGSLLTNPNPANGDQTSGQTNFRVFFTFGAADHVNKVVFSSTDPAFEFDNIYASWTSAVPEPATWTMLILGFGFVGFMLRSNRRKDALVAA